MAGRSVMGPALIGVGALLLLTMGGAKKASAAILPATPEEDEEDEENVTVEEDEDPVGDVALGEITVTSPTGEVVERVAAEAGSRRLPVNQLELAALLEERERIGKILADDNATDAEFSKAFDRNGAVEARIAILTAAAKKPVVITDPAQIVAPPVTPATATAPPVKAVVAVAPTGNVQPVAVPREGPLPAPVATTGDKPTAVVAIPISKLPVVPVASPPTPIVAPPVVVPAVFTPPQEPVADIGGGDAIPDFLKTAKAEPVVAPINQGAKTLEETKDELEVLEIDEEDKEEIAPEEPEVPEVPVAPPAPVATAPARVPADTAKMVAALLADEANANWKEKSGAVMDWQESRGLTSDGLFGPKTALTIAAEIGTVPIVRFWPRSSFRESNHLPDYRKALRALSMKADEPRASQLVAAADREQGQGFGRGQTPIKNLIVLGGSSS